MYKCKYFKIYELVYPELYNYAKQTGNINKLWNFFDEELLITIDNIRELNRSSIKINDWYWGGNYSLSGLRPYDSLIGAFGSFHKFGKAFDLKFNSIEQIRQDILNNPFQEEFKYITCLEMDVSWLHIDCRNRDKVNLGILKIYP